MPGLHYIQFYIKRREIKCNPNKKRGAKQFWRQKNDLLLRRLRTLGLFMSSSVSVSELEAGECWSRFNGLPFPLGKLNQF
jgi:predicted solute-binding protein